MHPSWINVLISLNSLKNKAKYLNDPNFRTVVYINITDAWTIWTLWRFSHHLGTRFGLFPQRSLKLKLINWNMETREKLLSHISVFTQHDTEEMTNFTITCLHSYLTFCSSLLECFVCTRVARFKLKPPHVVPCLHHRGAQGLQFYLKLN